MTNWKNGWAAIARYDEYDSEGTGVVAVWGATQEEALAAVWERFLQITVSDEEGGATKEDCERDREDGAIRLFSAPIA